MRFGAGEGPRLPLHQPGKVSRLSERPESGRRVPRLKRRLCLYTVRRLSPYISVLVLALQFISSGLFGPRMVCTDSDGTQSIELAALTCCSVARAATGLDDAGAHDGCCPTDCGGTRQEPKRGPQVGTGGCGCVDVPAADDPAWRHSDSRLMTDFAAVHLATTVMVVVAWPEPIAHGGPAAFLPHGHAPPREHIATIVLRI